MITPYLLHPMKKSLFALLLLTAGLLLHSSSTAFAQENADMVFDISTSIVIDETKDQITLPDVTLKAKRDLKGIQKFTIHIPDGLYGIFSSDLSRVVISGNAAMKVKPIDLSSLSLDQRSIDLIVVQDLIINDTLFINGLIFKVYRENNPFTPLELSYADQQGQTQTLQTTYQIRLDSRGLLRRIGTPEPVRNFQMNADGNKLVISWSPNADRDVQNYHVRLKKSDGYNYPVDLYLEKNVLTYTSAELLPQTNYELNFQIVNIGNYVSEVTKTFTLEVLPKFEVPVVTLPEPEVVVAPAVETVFSHLDTDKAVFTEMYRELLPPSAQQEAFDGDVVPSFGDVSQLLQAAALSTAMNDSNQTFLESYILRLETRSGRSVSANDVILLIYRIVAGEALENIVLENLLEIPAGLPIAQRQYLLRIKRLQQKGIVEMPEVFTDRYAEVRQENLYKVLWHVLDRIKKENMMESN